VGVCFRISSGGGPSPKVGQGLELLRCNLCDHFSAPHSPAYLPPLHEQHVAPSHTHAHLQLHLLPHKHRPPHPPQQPTTSAAGGAAAAACCTTASAPAAPQHTIPHAPPHVLDCLVCGGLARLPHLASKFCTRAASHVGGTHHLLLMSAWFNAPGTRSVSLAHSYIQHTHTYIHIHIHTHTHTHTRTHMHTHAGGLLPA